MVVAKKSLPENTNKVDAREQYSKNIIRNFLLEKECTLISC
jgi:hypothetical protein